MCYGGIKMTVVMSTILTVVLSVLLYYNILVVKQVGQEVDSLTKYFQSYVERPSSEKIDFERLVRANILVINGDSAGSGTVIAMEKGYIYILTARHVAQSAKDKDVLEIEVPMIDKNYKDTNNRHMNIDGCQYVVVDKAKDVVICSDYDMALIRIRDFSGHELSYLLPGKKDPKLGDTLYTIGNPMCARDIIARGLYTGTETNKGITAGRVYGGITFGNSGGAVVNEDGEIIGVVFAKDLSFPVSYIGIYTLRKQMITFVVEGYKTFEKKDTVSESNKNIN